MFESVGPCELRHCNPTTSTILVSSCSTFMTDPSFDKNLVEANTVSHGVESQSLKAWAMCHDVDEVPSSSQQLQREEWHEPLNPTEVNVVTTTTDITLEAILDKAAQEVEGSSLDDLFPNPMRPTSSDNGIGSTSTTMATNESQKLEILSELVDDLSGITNQPKDMAMVPTSHELCRSVFDDPKDLASSNHSSSFASIGSDIFDDSDPLDDDMEADLPDSLFLTEMHQQQDNKVIPVDRRRQLETTTMNTSPNKKQRKNESIVDKSVMSAATTALKDYGSDTHVQFRNFQKDQWFQRFQELCTYRKKFGHCQVPHGYEANPSLARWLKRQRYQYKLRKEGKPSTITVDRINALENLGIIWDSQNAQWEERFNELKVFKKLHGHCNVPSNYPDNQKLAVWVKVQRRQHKLLCNDKMSNMTSSRIKQLNSLGFTWEIRKTDSRSEM